LEVRHGEVAVTSGRGSSFQELQIGDISFACTSFQGAVDWVIARAAAGGSGLNIRLANAYNVTLAHEQVEYRNLLARTGLNFPDGAPVAWLMHRRARGRVTDRVRGPSLFRAVLDQGRSADLTHFFMGSTDETLARLCAAVKRDYPGARIVGSFSPPFANVDDDFVDLCLEEAERAGASIIWLGLGTPKQDQLGTRLSEKADLLTVNVGAAFDFVAGTVREAPNWVQKSGFEWLYRLVSEPGRLWRRYLIGNFQFLRAVTSRKPAHRKA